MRITFVLPQVSLAGGIRVVASHATRLRRRGHDVLMVSVPWWPTPLRRKIKYLLQGRGWVNDLLPEPSHLDGLSIPHRVLPEYRPVTDADLPDADVVIATWWETAEWVAALSPAKGAKVYFVQGHEVWEDQPAPRVAATWRLPMQKIAVARWLVDLARERYGDPDACLVPNSVDTDEFHAPPRDRQSQPTVGLVYSPMWLKGTDVSLEAFAQAARARPDLRLIAFGTDAPGPPLPLPAQARYIRQPARSALKDIYAACDAWLFGSRCEGFGLPILEAMACRTPVIATPAGAAPDLLSSSGGLLVLPQAPRAMADAIETICAMPAAQWRELSDRAYATATRYTWDDAADLFEQALHAAVARAGRGRITDYPLSA